MVGHPNQQLTDMNQERSHLATLEDLAAMERRIAALLHQPHPPHTAAETWLTLDQVACRTGHDKSTVQRWVKTGKLLSDGSRLKLGTVRFCTSDPRIPASALAAFAEAK